MRSFDGLQTVERPGTNRRDLQRHRVLARKRRLPASVKRKEKKPKDPLAYLFGALAPDGNKDAPLGSIGLAALHRQIRTANDAKDDLPIDDQRETHRILSTAQESLCPVDGIERPSPYEKHVNGTLVTRTRRLATHARCDPPGHSHGRSRPGVPQGCVPDQDRVPSAGTRRSLDRP